jgi:hypothetical protein
MTPDNSESIFDIRPPVNIPFLTPLEWSIAGGVLLALALLAAWFLWRKLDKPLAILLPIEKARLQFLEIEKTKDSREAGHRLSECMRGYINEDYQIDALEMTTLELARAAHQNPLLSGKAEEIQKLLEELDILRFSNGISKDIKLLTQESKTLIETLHSILIEEKKKQIEAQKQESR